MPRTCTVCGHAKREEIDAAILAKESYRDIASRFGLNKASVNRHHAAGHVVQAVIVAKQERDIAHALDLVQQLIDINAVARRVMADAVRSGDGTLALKACAEVLKQSEFQARIAGELKDQPTVNVLIMPEWGTIRAALLGALLPYPEARAAVAGRLLQLEAVHVSG